MLFVAGLKGELPRRRDGVRLRCYFHLVNGQLSIPDDDGLEVSDPETAKLEALKAIHALRHEDPEAEEDWRDWKLNIADASGNVILSIPLDMPLH